MLKKKSEGPVTRVDTEVYPPEVIQAAAYALTDRAYVRMARAGASHISVELQSKAGNGGAEALAGEFQERLLHQALRVKISDANLKIREYVVTKALITGDALTGVSDILPPGTVPESPRNGPRSESQGEPVPGPQGRGAPQEPPRRAGAPAVDEELEAEIEKLLAEIEKSEPEEGAVGPAKKKAKKGKAKAGKTR